MAEKIPGQSSFDWSIGQWFIHGTNSQEFCKDGKPHDFIDGKVCSRCGMTAFEHAMLYSQS